MIISTKMEIDLMLKPGFRDSALFSYIYYGKLLRYNANDKPFELSACWMANADIDGPTFGGFRTITEAFEIDYLAKLLFSTDAVVDITFVPEQNGYRFSLKVDKAKNAHMHHSEYFLVALLYPYILNTDFRIYYVLNDEYGEAELKSKTDIESYLRYQESFVDNIFPSHPAINTVQITGSDKVGFTYWVTEVALGHRRSINFKY